MNKYEQFAADYDKAVKATVKLENTEDGGTCNFDAPALKVERWQEKKLDEALRAYGYSCFKWTGRSMVWGYVLSVPSSGQGNRRSRRAEAIKDELIKMGYDMSMYYQAD